MKRAFAVAAVLGCTALAGVPAAVASTAAGAAVARPVAAAGTAATPKKYLGVYEKGVPGSYKPIETFAKAVRVQPGLVLTFSSWNEPFNTGFADQLHAMGSEPLIQINPTKVSLADIATGKYDSYLTTYANDVKAFGYPVVIGFAHEMNGWWYSWGWKHTPIATWKAAWRHVVDVFRATGATNVTWLWTIDRNPGAEKVIPRYWPGAKYVDWVGIDGYYFRPTDTFHKIFLPIIRKVRKFTNKPILLAETAIGQKAGQTRKIPDLFAGIQRYHLLGLVWYDVHQHGGIYHQNWSLEGHTAALKVFRRKVAQMLKG